MSSEDRKSFIAGCLVWLIEETRGEAPEVARELKDALQLWIEPTTKTGGAKVIPMPARA